MRALMEKIKNTLDGFYENTFKGIKDSALVESVTQSFLNILEQIQQSETYEKLQATYQNLDDNGKRLVKWISIGISGLLVLTIVLAALSYLNEFSSRIDKAKKLIEEIKLVSDSSKDSETAIRSLKRNFRVDDDFKVGSFIEAKASEVGIEKIESFSEKGTQKKEYITVTNYVIKATKVHLRSLVDLIYGIENSGHPLFVNGLKMTRLFSNIKYFNIEMMISHKKFSKEEEKENEK